MEKIKLFLKKWIPLICLFLGVLLISFIAGRCSTKKERSTSMANLRAVRDSVHTYKVVINDLENTVYEQGAVVLTQSDAIKVGIIERERLRKLNIKELITNTGLSGTIQILRDSLKLPPDVQFVTIKDTSGTYLAVKVPYQWQFSDQYISLTTGIGTSKTGWFKLQVPFSGTISVGYIKSGFLKTTPKGVFTTLNPYIKIDNMDVLIVQDKDKFYNKTWFHMLAGAVILETGHQLLKK